jgi:hypothetical protein
VNVTPELITALVALVTAITALVKLLITARAIDQVSTTTTATHAELTARIACLESKQATPDELAKRSAN